MGLTRRDISRMYTEVTFGIRLTYDELLIVLEMLGRNFRWICDHATRVPDIPEDNAKSYQFHEAEGDLMCLCIFSDGNINTYRVRDMECAGFKVYPLCDEMADIIYPTSESDTICIPETFLVSLME